MITVTWQDGSNAAETFIISDEVLSSFELYRLTLTAPQQTASGQWASLPKYATIKDVVVGTFLETLVNPALSMFPPAQIAQLMEQAKAANAALAAAKAAAAQGVFAEPVVPTT
jgi:hypothetical protein